MSEDAKIADEYDCDISVHSLSVAVRYYRSLEYCVELKSFMYTRRSSRLQHASTKNAQESPSSDDDVVQRRLQSKRRRTWLREAGVDADEGSRCDIIDLIDRTHCAKHVTVEDSGKLIEINDRGLDESGEDCGSDDGSIVSGPSLKHISSPKELRPSQSLCSGCRKRYQKAKKTKARIEEKLLDNDPSSLTCDQWVLLKQWRPRRLPDARGSLLMHVQLVKNDANQSERYSGNSSACSRPHAFLQRNLMRCVQVLMKKERKKNRRKRARDDSQGSRIAKQKRRRSNNAGQHTNGADDGGLHCASGHSSSPSLEGNGSEENIKESDQFLVQINPSSVSLGSNNPVNVSPKQEAPTQRTQFKDLLAQLRGNSSIIIRETR